MKAIEFSWDPNKARVNDRKHGVSFDEASAAFWDTYARLRHDPDHSEKEDRYILLGLTIRLRLVVVCHSYRKSDRVIRIISARKATKFEARQYAGSL
jgi:uncharacterized protein